LNNALAEEARRAFEQAVADCETAGRAVAAATETLLDRLAELDRPARPVVRQRIDAQFEDELVDAAARSAAGHAIQNLPLYLQELARKRRLALQRAKTAG
jgi:hypothetical protein